MPEKQIVSVQWIDGPSMTPFLDLLSCSLKQWSFQEVTDSIPGGLKALKKVYMSAGISK